MGLAMFKRRRAVRQHVVSPAAAAYAPMMLSPNGVRKLEQVMDSNSKIGKPSRPPRAANRRERSHV